ncbi:hypothetical protein FRC07_002532 [Ceratobasidium sp. 392]|nr:hypothetical protein FRC07_002532 [Ceratobasidium sp. 392]
MSKRTNPDSRVDTNPKAAKAPKAGTVPQDKDATPKPATSKSGGGASGNPGALKDKTNAIAKMASSKSKAPATKTHKKAIFVYKTYWLYSISWLISVVDSEDEALLGNKDGENNNALENDEYEDDKGSDAEDKASAKGKGKKQASQKNNQKERFTVPAIRDIETAANGFMNKQANLVALSIAKSRARQEAAIAKKTRTGLDEDSRRAFAPKMYERAHNDRLKTEERIAESNKYTKANHQKKDAKTKLNRLMKTANKTSLYDTPGTSASGEASTKNGGKGKEAKEK